MESEMDGEGGGLQAWAAGQVQRHWRGVATRRALAATMHCAMIRQQKALKVLIGGWGQELIPSRGQLKKHRQEHRLAGEIQKYLDEWGSGELPLPEKVGGTKLH